MIFRFNVIFVFVPFYRVVFNKINDVWQLSCENHPYLQKMLEQDPKLQILGPQFHEISDRFKIGDKGLRLTVCKLKVKTGGNKNDNEITEEKMNEKR